MFSNVMFSALRSSGYISVNRSLSKRIGPEKAFWIGEFLSIYMYRLSNEQLDEEGRFFIIPAKWTESNGMSVTAFRRIAAWAEKEGFITTKTKGIPPKKFYCPTTKLEVFLMGVLSNPYREGDGEVKINPDIQDSHILATDRTSSRNREDIVVTLDLEKPPFPPTTTTATARKTPKAGIRSLSPEAQKKIAAKRAAKQQEILDNIFTIWKDTKPLDDSRGRARKHIDKLIKSGVRVQRLEEAAINYLNAQWVTAEKRKAEKPDGEFVRKVGNFFGRDGEWEDWTDDRVDQDLLEIRYR